MKTQIFFPSAELRSVVQRYEFFHFDNEQPLPGSFLFLPSFVNGLLFNFYQGQPALLSNDKIAKHQVQGENLVSSVTRPAELSRICQTTSIRVIFHPGALAALFDKPMGAFVNQSLSLSESLDRELYHLWQRLGNELQLKTQLSMIEAYLKKRLASMKRFYSLYPVLDQHFQQSGYQMGVAQLARKIGVGERDLNRKLNKQLGIPMTRFISIHRFNTAVRQLQHNPVTPLTDLAYQLDYSDQPHFNREFKRLSGMTPGQFRKGIRQGKLLLPKLGDEIHGTGALFKRA